MDANLILMRDGFFKFAIYRNFSNFPDDCGFHFHLRLKDEYTSSFIEVRGLFGWIGYRSRIRSAILTGGLPMSGPPFSTSSE